MKNHLLLLVEYSLFLDLQHILHRYATSIKIKYRYITYRDTSSAIYGAG